MCEKWQQKKSYAAYNILALLSSTKTGALGSTQRMEYSSVVIKYFSGVMQPRGQTVERDIVLIDLKQLNIRILLAQD